jgi:hypothetical protein
MPSILDPIPNNPFYSPQTNSISTPQGYVIAGSGVSVDQFGYLNVASALGGTVTSITAGTGLSGGTITVAGTIDLIPATNVSLGGVKIGANLLIAPDGTLSALPPSTGTVNSITVGTGLSGGGAGPAVSITLDAASKTQFGGVVIGNGIDVTGGLISLTAASTTQVGGVSLATGAEAITGTNATKAITPAALAAKTGTTTRPGIVQLSDSVASPDSTKAATQTAAFTANAAAVAAQNTANAALPKAGGTMTGVITFAPGQTFPGVAFPVATANSLGVISVGPGLNVNSSGVLSTANNGTVTAVIAGPGLGAPASGNTISTSGTLRLLPPTTDGIQLGGVKAGANVDIAFDGTISVPGNNFIASNNPYPFNGYIWPAANAPGPGPIPLQPFPGINGQVLTVIDNVAGTIGWTSTGTLQSVVAGPGITVNSTPTTATVSLTTVPSVVSGTYGGTALIPTLTVNNYGQITSTGLANPYSPYQTATVTAPPALVLDFAGNNLNWEWTLQGNTTIQDPLNAQSGQSGYILIRQNPLVPYTITWGSAWKFENFTPYGGNAALSGVDMITFTVVSPNYIVVTKVTTDIG